MADPIAIGYPDETTALAAMDEAEQLQHELIIQADATARSSGTRRARSGRHQPPRGGGRRDLGDVPGECCIRHAVLRPVPGTCGRHGRADGEGDQERGGQAVPGPGLGHVCREPALFMVVEKVTRTSAVEAMLKFYGTVLKSSLVE